MKRPSTHWYGVLLLLIGLLLSCTRGLEDRLVGQWELRNESWHETLELFEDGSYRINADWGLGNGRWRLVDKDHLALWSHKHSDERINSFWVEDDDLILVDVRSETLAYRRLK